MSCETEEIQFFGTTTIKILSKNDKLPNLKPRANCYGNIATCEPITVVIAKNGINSNFNIFFYFKL